MIKIVGKKEITIINDNKIDYEMGIFKMVEIKNSNYTYAADTKVLNSHDDIVMALAMAGKCINSTSGVYSFGSTKKKSGRKPSHRINLH